MLFQLPDGGTIHIREEVFFTMSDDEFELMLMKRRGSEINDPFHNSVLKHGEEKEYDYESFDVTEEDDILYDPLDE